MPTDIVEIASYEYYQFSSREDEKANILCEGIGGHLISLQFKGGTVTFPPPVKTSRNSGGTPGNLYILYFRYSDMANIVDMLRNEKPVYLKFVSESVNNSRISTSAAEIS